MSSKKQKLRVVIDTNVLLSKIISKNGTAGRVVDMIMREHIFLICTETLAELSAKLSEKKFFRYGTEEELTGFIASIEGQGHYVDVRTEVTASPDPKDDIFLSLAIDGRADFIVSGDKKHLLPLHPYEGIPILSPADFLAAMASSLS
jgi:putative PIN family toxin of toxin-antitoxin system